MPILLQATVRPHPRFLLGWLLRKIAALILVVAGLSHWIRPAVAENLDDQPRKPNIVVILADDK